MPLDISGYMWSGPDNATPFTSKYLVCSHLPQVFIDADRMKEEQFPTPRFVRKEYEVPMPVIDSCGLIHGPLKVTHPWYQTEKLKKMINYEKMKRSDEVKAIQLLAKRDLYRSKLSKLDPSKKHDAKLIAAYNIELHNIDIDLQCVRMQTGVDIEQLDHGTRVGRFMARMKKKAVKMFKKVKRFCRDNVDIIASFVAILAPFVGSFLAKLII